MSDTLVIPESHKTNRNLIMFAIPSLLGLFFFLAPLTYDGNFTFPLALMAKGVKAVLGDAILPTVTAVICFSAAASVAASLLKPAFVTQSPLLTRLFVLTPAWLVIRSLGAVFTLMALHQIGTE